LYAHTHTIVTRASHCIHIHPSLHRFRRHCLHWDFPSFWNCFCHQSIKRQEVYSEVPRVNFNRRLVHCRLTLYLKPHFNPKLPGSLLPLARLLISLQYCYTKFFITINQSKVIASWISIVHAEPLVRWHPRINVARGIVYVAGKELKGLQCLTKQISRQFIQHLVRLKE